MEKFILIDGSGLIYRGFYAIPPFLKSPSGVQTNAVFGFTNILLSLITHQKPDYIAVAFDKKGPTFRHKEFAEYKATRPKAPQALYDQIPLVRVVVETFGVPMFEADGFEADDIIATIIRELSGRRDLQILIATGDFDLFQVVDSHTSILYPVKGFKDATVFSAADIKAKYGLLPNQISDFKGLAGDSSDNIPGVKGIGEKGAKDLLQEYISIENIYKNLPHISETLRKKLEAGHKDALFSKKLATLDNNVPIQFDLNACRVKHFDANAARQLFAEFGFKNLQKRLDELYGTASMQGSLFG